MHLVQPGRYGSIPVCTGEPKTGCRISCWVAVYPRVYGGTHQRPAFLLAPVGLSPCVRGNLTRVLMLELQIGSIPVCTGEPNHASCSARAVGLSPCVRGNQRPVAEVLLGGGLSPCVRGNPPTTGIPSGSSRSIPVCTGEPVKGKRDGRNDMVYPRVYGGTRKLRSSSNDNSGLSPCVRGNPRI